MQGRTKALKDFIKSQKGYSNTISNTDCMAIIGLNSEEEEKDETTKEADTKSGSQSHCTHTVKRNTERYRQCLTAWTKRFNHSLRKRT